MTGDIHQSSRIFSRGFFFFNFGEHIYFLIAVRSRSRRVRPVQLPVNKLSARTRRGQNSEALKKKYTNSFSQKYTVNVDSASADNQMFWLFFCTTSSSNKSLYTHHIHHNRTSVCTQLLTRDRKQKKPPRSLRPRGSARIIPIKTLERVSASDGGTNTRGS